MGVVEYPRARAVELARGVVAPQQYPSQPRLCFGRPVRRRGEAALRLAIRLRPALPRALHQSRAILGVPVAAPELPQLRRQSFVQRCEMGDVLFGMFELARGYKDRQMAAYSELQEAEFAAEINGYTATKHQREVGTGYFDAVSMAISGGKSSTTAMHESTEHDQFRPAAE